MEERLISERFQSVARSVARRVAEDVIAGKTDLDALDDGEAYYHALNDLTGYLTECVAVSLMEGTRIWLEQREAGAN